MNQYVTGAVIKELREKYHLTQAELAQKLNVSDKTVSKWETAKGYPDISLLEPIAKAFGVKEFAIRKMKEQASMFRKKALKSAVDMLSDSDYKIKYGLADGDGRAYLALFKIMTDR